MKPGATTSPSASMVDDAGPSTSPTAAMRPPLTATSTRRRGAPVPSTTVPSRITRSYMADPLPCRPDRSPPRPGGGSVPLVDVDHALEGLAALATPDVLDEQVDHPFEGPR